MFYNYRGKDEIFIDLDMLDRVRAVLDVGRTVRRLSEGGRGLFMGIFGSKGRSRRDV